MFELDRYTKDILNIYEYCSKKYPEPRSYFGESHITIRSVEIWAYETAVSRCVNICADPYDVIADFMWELLAQVNSQCCNDSMRWKLKHAIEVLDDIENFILKERGKNK